MLNNDADAEGDACDADDDNDTVADGGDNCQFDCEQRPGEQRSLIPQGDACDPNDDNDAHADGSDNCQLVANNDQFNTDGDGLGDACDPNDDNDAHLDGSDNCQLIANNDQLNNDARR